MGESASKMIDSFDNEQRQGNECVDQGLSLRTQKLTAAQSREKRTGERGRTNAFKLYHTVYATVLLKSLKHNDDDQQQL